MSNGLNYDEYLQKLLAVVDALVADQNYEHALNLLAAFCNNYKDKLRGPDARLLVFAQERLANLLLQFTDNAKDALRYIRMAMKTCKSRAGEHISEIMHTSCLRTLCAAHKAMGNRADLLKDATLAAKHCKKKKNWADFAAFALYRLDELIVCSKEHVPAAREFIEKEVLSVAQLKPEQLLFFRLLHAQMVFRWAPKQAGPYLTDATKRLMELTRTAPSHYLRILWVYCSILVLAWMERGGTWSSKYKMSDDTFNASHFLRTIESYYNESTKIYQSTSPLRFLEWAPQGEIEAMLSLFKGLAKRSEGDFTTALTSFAQSAKSVEGGAPTPNFTFLINSLACECHLVQEDFQKAAEVLCRIIDNYADFSGGHADRRYRAIIIHSLCAHYSIALQLLVQAKNHCKRLYRLTQKDEVLVRIYARLQLALLRLGFGGTNTGETAADRKKSEKELSRYSKEVDDCNCPILKGCAMVADGLLKCLQGRFQNARTLWRETLKACDDQLGDSRITAAALTLMGNHLFEQSGDTGQNTEQVLCSALQAGTKHPSKSTQLAAAWILMKMYEARKDPAMEAKAQQLRSFLRDTTAQFEVAKARANDNTRTVEKITGWHNNLTQEA